MASAYRLALAASYCTLVPVLLMQLYLASKKLSTGQPGTFISRTSNPTLRAPAIMICNGEELLVPLSPPNSTLVSLYSHAKEKSAVDYLVYIDPVTENMTNLLDPEQLRASFNVSVEEAWEIRYQYWVFPNSNFILSKCLVLKSFFLFKPSMISQLYLSSNSKMFVTFHEDGQLTHGYTNVAGNEPYPEGVMMPPGSTSQVEVMQKRVSRLSKPDRPCTEDNSETLKTCIDDHIINKMNCALPWEKGTKRLCDTIEDFAAYRQVVAEVYNLYLTLEEILERTGCRVNCMTTEYTARTMFNVNITFWSTHRYNMMVVMPQTSTIYEKEIDTYDGNNFVADTGGFLGLLLGLSAMDAAKAIAGAITRKAKRTN